MTGRRALRFALFFLELPRLALVLAAASGAGGPSGAALAAPHALFVLLALFSWYDPDRYEAFRPLYAAGKLVSAVAVAAWLARALPAAASTLGVADSRSLAALAAGGALALYDAATGAVVGIAAMRFRAEASALSDLPELVVDELPDDSGGS